MGWGSEEELEGKSSYYIDAGGNFIDTANVYTEGHSEELLGKFINNRGLRDQIVLATSFQPEPKPTRVVMEEHLPSG